MISNNNNLNLLSFQFSSPLFIAGLFCFISSSTFANSIAVNHSQLEQYITFLDEDVLLNPTGEGLFVSLDLNDHWLVKFDYQTWQDNKQANKPASIDVALTSFGGGLSYNQDNWYASTSIGFSDDDVSYRGNHSNRDFRQDNTQVTAISAVIGKSWLKESWMLDLSIGFQYADWTIENKVINNEQAQQDGKPPEEISNSKSNSTGVNVGISVARYWELTQEQGILAGVLLSWNYQFSGDETFTANNPPPPRRASVQQATTRNVSGNTSRITSGDDNYGQLSAYLSYELNNHWSVDLDTAIEIDTDNNNFSWAIGINYTF